MASGGAEAIWLEHVAVATRPALDLDALRGRSDMVGLLVREIEAADAGDLGTLLQPWIGGLLDRAGVLRGALGPGHAAVQAADGTLPADLLERAKALLLARLVEH